MVNLFTGMEVLGMSALAAESSEHGSIVVNTATCAEYSLTLAGCTSGAPSAELQWVFSGCDPAAR